MKILQIHHSLSGGGIEAMICALANELVRTEDVSVCSIFLPKPDDVFWYKLSPMVKKVTLGKIKPGFSLKELFLIYKLIKDNRYEIVHVHSKFYYYMLSVFLLHRRVKFFYTVHTDAKKENSMWDRVFFPLKRLCFRLGIIHPVTISIASRESFYKMYHCYSDLVYNGVKKIDIPLEDKVGIFKNNEETRVFIHAGRIDTPKNQFVLCRVFRRLVDEGHNIVLLIVGAKQKDDIYRTIESFFSNNIRYLGERSDVPQLMSQCEAMCLPSIWEGLPVTVLEALSVGCVPICSNVGGIPEVIEPGFNGFLSIGSSEEDYYKIMKKYLSLSSLEINQIKANCIKSFEKYDISNTVKSYLAVYESY